MTQYSGSDALFRLLRHQARGAHTFRQNTHTMINTFVKRRVGQELGAGGRRRPWEALPAGRRRGLSRDHPLFPPNPQVIPSRSSPVVPCKLGLIRLFPTRIGRVRMGSCILDPVPPHSSELSCARPLCQSPSGFGGRGTDTSRRHVERGFLCLYCPQAQGLPGVPVSAPNSSSQALQ